MKNAIRLMIATLTLATASFAGVTVSSPAAGSTAGSPVHFVASATSANPITAMRIYVDNISVYLISASKLEHIRNYCGRWPQRCGSSLGLNGSRLQGAVEPDRKRYLPEPDPHSNSQRPSPRPLQPPWSKVISTR